MFCAHSDNTHVANGAVTTEVAQRMLEEADTDGGGDISYDEFVAAMTMQSVPSPTSQSDGKAAGRSGSPSEPLITAESNGKGASGKKKKKNGSKKGKQNKKQPNKSAPDDNSRVVVSELSISDDIGVSNPMHEEGDVPDDE
jgi:hypothetical protein